MRAQPVIGITTRLFDDPDGFPVLGARHLYAESISRAGGSPLLIPLTDDQSLLNRLFDLCDGLVIHGGEDIDPARYGEPPHPELGRTAPLRDELEIALVRRAWGAPKPLLGICRGLQVMNVALGGSLYQDIPSQCAGAIRHSSTSYTELVHEISFEASSRLGSLFGGNSCSVNSLHHQSVKEVASELRLVARAPDGVVEALEAPDRPFFVGVQCHPEALWQKLEPRWIGLFEGLVEASRG